MNEADVETALLAAHAAEDKPGLSRLYRQAGEMMKNEKNKLLLLILLCIL